MWRNDFILHGTISAKMASSWTCDTLNFQCLFSYYCSFLNPVLAIESFSQFFTFILFLSTIWDIDWSLSVLYILSGLQSLSHLCTFGAIFGCRPAKVQGSLMMKYLIHLHLYRRTPSIYLQCTSKVKQVGDLLLCWPLCAISFDS